MEVYCLLAKLIICKIMNILEISLLSIIFVFLNRRKLEFKEKLARLSKLGEL